MEQRLIEVNELSNESQVRLTQTTEVLKGLEDKLNPSQVNIRILLVSQQDHFTALILPFKRSQISQTQYPPL